MDEDQSKPVRIIVKKKKGHAGHHGGAWKVAYADFVTAMMALFIVRGIVGQRKEVTAAVQAYFRDPGVFTSGRAGGVMPGEGKGIHFPSPGSDPTEGPTEVERLKAAAGNLQKMISAIPDFSKFKDKIEVVVTEQGMRIDLVENSEGLFFDIGKANLKPDTVRLHKLIASRRGTLQNRVVIEGYTDASPYAGTGYSNWNLSTDRANAARVVLEGNGLQPNQLREVRGFADRNLKLPDKPYDFANRRVSILVATSGRTAAPREARPADGEKDPKAGAEAKDEHGGAAGKNVKTGAAEAGGAGAAKDMDAGGSKGFIRDMDAGGASGAGAPDARHPAGGRRGS
jgi:chemotaxis protein MotB